MWYLYKYTENIESVVKYFSVAFIRTYIHLQPQQKSSQGDEERRRKYPESMSSTNRLVAKTKRLIVTHMWGLTLRKEKRTSTMWLESHRESWTNVLKRWNLLRSWRKEKGEWRGWMEDSEGNAGSWSRWHVCGGVWMFRRDFSEPFNTSI